MALTLENNSTGLEGEEEKSPRTGPCLKNQEDRGAVGILFPSVNLCWNWNLGDKEVPFLSFPSVSSLTVGSLTNFSVPQERVRRQQGPLCHHHPFLAQC